MIIYECHSVALVVVVISQTATVQSTPLALAESIVDIVFEWKVESGRLNDTILFSTINPIGYHRFVAIPTFTDRKFGLGSLVILTNILGCISFHKVIAESFVS